MDIPQLPERVKQLSANFTSTQLASLAAAFVAVVGIVAGSAYYLTRSDYVLLMVPLLVETGVPMGLAIASVHERRDGFRKLLGRPNRKEQLELAKKRLRREKTLGGK